MKYKFCSIRINGIKYDVTFITKGGVLTSTFVCGKCVLTTKVLTL